MVTTFYPPHIGGIEYHVENLSKELVHMGHKVTVITSGTKFQESYEKINNVEIFRFQTFFLSGKFYPSLSSQGVILNIENKIKRLVKERHVDVIHVHGHHYYLSWKSINVASKLGIPTVLTLHGLYALRPSDYFAEIGEKLFNYTVFANELRQANAIVGLTSKIAEYAKKYCPGSNYFIIPNGVNYHIFEENSRNRSHYRKKYQIDAEKTVILFRGRFAPIKGVLELAEAAKIIVQKNPQMFFLFVGGGPLKDELIKILQPIKDNSKVVDWTPMNELHELYLASDVFVLPSKSEALPLTILEAMAAKLYIIATPVGGIPEVLKDYPFKTMIKNSAFSTLHETLLKGIEQNSLVKQKSSEVNYLDNFDWLKIAYKVENIYQLIQN